MNSAWSSQSSPEFDKSYIHDVETKQIKPLDVRIPQLVYKFYWDRNKSQFYKQWNLRNKDPNMGPIPHPKIWELLKTIESKSGVKPLSGCLTFFLLVLLAGFGLGLGVYLIRIKQVQLAGIAFFFTPLFAFFVVIGTNMTRGTQVSRIDKWMKKNRGKLNKELYPIGYKVYHSFNTGKRKLDDLKFNHFFS